MPGVCLQRPVFRVGEAHDVARGDMRVLIQRRFSLNKPTPEACGIVERGIAAGRSSECVCRVSAQFGAVKQGEVRHCAVEARLEAVASETHAAARAEAAQIALALHFADRAVQAGGEDAAHRVAVEPGIEAAQGGKGRGVPMPVLITYACAAQEATFFGRGVRAQVVRQCRRIACRHGARGIKRIAGRKSQTEPRFIVAHIAGQPFDAAYLGIARQVVVGAVAQAGERLAAVLVGG